MPSSSLTNSLIASKARLKHSLRLWPLEKYLDETEKLLGYKLFRVPLFPVADEATRQSGSQLEEKNPPAHVGGYGHTHVGVFPQKQPGLN